MTENETYADLKHQAQTLGLPYAERLLLQAMLLLYDQAERHHENQIETLKVIKHRLG